MSRLSRLRSFWRSLRRGTVRDGSYRPHQAVNLLPLEYRKTPEGRVAAWVIRTDRRHKAFLEGGTPPERGSWVLSASTGTKEHGTRTPETATTAVSSSFCQPGNPWAGAYVQISPHRGNSFTERGWSTGATGIPGANGAPRGPAA